MAVWSCKRSGWIAIVTGVLFLLALAISIFTICIHSGAVTFTSYLSYDGGSYPENGIFNFLTSFTSVFGCVSIAIKYIDIEDRNSKRIMTINVLNKVSVFMGLASMIGLLIVASYPISNAQVQSTAPINYFHEVGTYMLSGFGILYCGLQTVFTLFFTKCSPFSIIRILLFTISLAAFIASTTVLHLKVETTLTTVVHQNLTQLRAMPDVLDQYLLSSFACERAFVLSYLLFYISFAFEFRRISIYLIVRPMATTSAARKGSWALSERI